MRRGGKSLRGFRDPGLFGMVFSRRWMAGGERGKRVNERERKIFFIFWISIKMDYSWDDLWNFWARLATCPLFDGFLIRLGLYKNFDKSRGGFRKIYFIKNPAYNPFGRKVFFSKIFKKYCEQGLRNVRDFAEKFS